MTAADNGSRSRPSLPAWSAWSLLPKRVDALGFGREVSKVARWLAGIGEGVAGRNTAIHAGRDRGARDTGLRREVVARALAQMRAAGLIHRVERSKGGRRAHGWQLGDLAAARWVPRETEPITDIHSLVRESITESVRESITESAKGVRKGVHNGVRVDSLSPLGGISGNPVSEPSAGNNGTPVDLGDEWVELPPEWAGLEGVAIVRAEMARLASEAGRADPWAPHGANGVSHQRGKPTGADEPQGSDG